MKKQVFNPYLPSYEYIPDGEPRVFSGRLYIYGSHDRFNGDVYCANDYVCWSAPEEDLSDWRYEGVIYKKPRIRGIRMESMPCGHRMFAAVMIGNTTCTTVWIS